MALYFKDGFVAGHQEGAGACRSVALGLLKAKRLNPMELFGGHECKDTDGIQQDAEPRRSEIEDRTARALQLPERR